MRKLYAILLPFALLITLASAGVIDAPKTDPKNGAVETSVPTLRSLSGSSKKQLKSLSVADMETVLGRKMTGMEKTAFRLNKKKFIQYSNLADEGRTNTMAIIGFVCSLIISPLGLIFGIIALGQIRKSGEKGQGWAIAAVAIGGLGTLLGLLLFF